MKFRGLNTKGKWVYGSLVETTSFIKHRPKQHTKTWIVESSFGNGGWFNIQRRQYVKPDSVEIRTKVLENGKEAYLPVSVVEIKLKERL